MTTNQTPVCHVIPLETSIATHFITEAVLLFNIGRVAQLDRK